MVGRGARVGGLAGGKIARVNPARTWELQGRSGGEVGGMGGVAVKCIDITQNSACEGSAPAPY